MTEPRLAPFLDAYPDLPSSVTEDDLLRAVVSGQQAQPCACGGVVVADVQDPEDGVRDHQTTERHTRWRAWVEV